MIRNYLLLVAVLLAGFQMTSADSPPSPGYQWVRINLFLSTQDDLSSYRFFLECGGDVYEATPVKGQRVEVKGCGSTPQFATGSVYAIPQTSAATFPADPSRDQMQTFSRDLYDKKVPGALALFQHHFRTQVKKGGDAGESEYRLSKTPDGIKAEEVATAKPVKPKTEDERLEQGQAGYGSMVGAGLLLTGLIVGGGFLVMRSKRRDGTDD